MIDDLLFLFLLHISSIRYTFLHNSLLTFYTIVCIIVNGRGREIESKGKDD